MNLRNTKRSRVGMIGTSVVLWFMTGCLSPSNVLPSGTSAIIEKCPLPCWGGITPRLTSRSDALIIIKSNYQLTKVDLDVTSIEWAADGSIGLAHRGELEIDNDVVATMVIWLEEGELTVDDFIRLAGNPEHMDVGLPSDSGEGCGFSLMYQPLGTNAHFTSNSTIDGLESIRLLNISPAGVLSYNPLDKTVEWNGYGDYGNVCGVP